MEKVKEYLEKAKDRVIHEFEYKNGKYIQHFVLGGEHELTPQEIIDCLNALETMTCDLQDARAYIKRQYEKNRELKEQLAIRDKALELAIDDGDNKITDACFVDRTAYNWDSQTPSMLCEEDYIEQAKESVK